ncbi:MAG: hypothetical protein SVE93_06030 [Candidatus Thermoplasmatota archaeon]|nr:hypothetical protein [Candidatus Thermoplasmatota archaeon]
MSKYPIKIGLVVIDKSAVKSSLRNKPKILYNYLVVDPVTNNILSALQTLQMPETTSITIQIDKSMAKEAIERFDKYFEKKT